MVERQYAAQPQPIAAAEMAGAEDDKRGRKGSAYEYKRVPNPIAEATRAREPRRVWAGSSPYGASAFRKICHSLWQFFPILLLNGDGLGFAGPPRQVESSHAPDISRRKSFNSGKVLPNIRRKPFHDGVTPSLGSLATNDQSADVSIELNEFPIDGQRRLDLRHP